MSKTRQKDLGFVELAAGQDPIVDIVAIHGLDGHREQTWKAENGVMWLRDLLPDDIPNARVLSYGYDADTRSFTRTSTHTIFHHAEAFAENLSQLRRMADPKRPIIFLAHSLGGIILKKMLVLCHSDGFNTDRNLRDIYVSTFAILFFGTPHSGANGVQLAELMGRMLSVYMHTNDLVLKDLGRDSSELEDIQRLYLPASNWINTIFFYEEYRTPIFGGMEKLIVPRPSAIIQGDGNAKVVALPADHCQIVKYTGKEDQNYQKVVKYLDELVKAARVKVQENWDRENAHRSIEKGELIPSSQPISPKPCIPVSRNYIQRQRIQDFITEKLLSSISPKHQPRCILHGLGGGGKTQLASFWIEEHKHKYNRIVVIDASSQEHIEADLETAIRSIGPQYSKATWKDAVTYLSGEKGWIMFFDNADQPDLQLDEYLPNSNNGAILVTSRNRECVAYAPDSHFQVGEMTESEAVDLLHSVAKITPSSNAASVAIVREVGMWALAITQAGAYIFRSRRLDKYLATFRKHRDKLMWEASLKGRNYKGSTYTAFDLSFGLLPKEAQEFMKVCAFLHHSAIPEALFEESTGSGFQTYTVMESCPPPDSDKTMISGLKDIFGSEWDDDSFQTLIDSVARGSLVDSFTNDNEKVFYNIHPLVQTYLKDRLGQSDKVQYAMLAGQLLLGAIRPLNDTGNVWHWQLLLHVEELPMEVKLGYPSHALAFVVLYESTGSCNGGCVLWGHCYSELHQMLGPQHPDTIMTMEYFAVTLHDRGELEEAERMKREVLSLQTEILGARHPHTITAMNNLATTLGDRGELEEAERMEREVLSLRTEILGPRHPHTITAMNNLATTLGDRGELEEAERIKREVLSLRTEILGPRHPCTITAMNNLAATLGDRGELEEAERMKREVLSLRTEILGPRHPDTIMAMNNLAATLGDRGELEEAERMEREVLSLRTEILGPRHPRTITAMNNLAATLHDRGELEEAERMKREVLSLRTEILGPRNPHTIMAMNNLVATLHDRGELEEAERVQREVLTLQTEILGHRHPHTIMAMNNLAATLHNRGELEEAERMEREVLSLQTEILGPRHPDTIMAMNNLATTLHDRGELEEAERVQREVLSLQTEILGARHPDTIMAMNNLAATLSDRGELEEAKRVQREVLSLRTEILGPRHPRTITAMNNLAATLSDRDELEEAERVQREVKQRSILTVPQDHIVLTQS